MSWQGSVHCFVGIAPALWTWYVVMVLVSITAILLCLINFSKCVDSETHDKTSLWIYWVVAGCSSLRYISFVIWPSIWAPADIEKSPVHFLQEAESVQQFPWRISFIFPPAGSAAFWCWVCPSSCLLHPGSLNGDSSYIRVNWKKWGIRTAKEKGIMIALLDIFTTSLIILTLTG